MNSEQLKNLVKTLPDGPGVYLMKNVKEKIIYVGKAKNLKARVRTYFNQLKDHSTKTRFLVSHITDIEYILTKTEVEAFLLEASLIKKHRPRYNIRLKDDKAYPYIRVDVRHEFPRLYLSRRVQNDGAIYFGPFSSGFAVRETIRFLSHTFKIRDCTDAFLRSRKRPCISYQIGRCTAPCVKYIEAAEYGESVQKAIRFLKGMDAKVIKELKKEMQALSDDERFEAAAKLRDSIRAIESVRERQVVVSNAQEFDQDVIAYVGDARGVLVEMMFVRRGRVIGARPHFLSNLHAEMESEDPRDWIVSFLNQYYVDQFLPDEIILPVDLGLDLTKLLQTVFKERHGKTPDIKVAIGVERMELLNLAKKNAESHFQDFVTKKEGRLRGLEEIQKSFGMKELPVRIECYDISHFQGQQTVASQVVFEDGVPKTDDYRRYKLRTVQGTDDYQSMREVLERRLKHVEYDDPNLIVVDGGKGQLKMAMEVLRELGREEIPLVALAKARVKGSFQDEDVITTSERFFLPNRQNPIVLNSGSEAFRILTGIRDEAHRFAIQYHRKLRSEVTLGSVLDEIHGLGDKRKQLLLGAFESVDAIREASVEDIASLSGFNAKLAEGILAQLNKEHEAPSEVGNKSGVVDTEIPEDSGVFVIDEVDASDTNTGTGGKARDKKSSKGQ